MTVRVLQTRLAVLGTGIALPGPAVSSEELLRRVEHNFNIKVFERGQKIADRLGIETRHISRELRCAVESTRAGDTNPQLAARALTQALQAAGRRVDELAFLIGHTTTPHTLLPANIQWVADELGFAGPSTELRQACTGFAAALQLVAGLVTGAGAAPVAIVGSETGSVFLDPRALRRDLGQLVNLVQMGDGAGAILLGAPTEGCSILECLFYGSVGLGRAPGFSLPQGGSAQSAASDASPVAMFAHDFRAIKASGGELFAAGLAAARGAGVDIDNVRFIIPHQVNGRIGEYLSELLGIPAERFFVEAHLVGNLGSAAIWVALHRLRVSGHLRPGDRVLVLGAEASKFMYGGFLYTHGPQG
jgi:3-oxoacyl-[acyl-carrier-protein] synthase III